MLNDLINDNLINLNEANHDKIKQQLLDQLEDMAKSINTGNIAPVVINQDIDQPAQKFDASMPMPGLTDLLNEIDQLKKENAKYKKAFEDMHQELNNAEVRQKAWEEFKKEKEAFNKQLEGIDEILERLDKLEKKRGKR